MSSHEIREFRDSDAHDIAVCFNEQHDSWPGGFNGGKDVTEKDVLRWVRTTEDIETYVSLEDGHARGFCNLIRSITEESDSAYIGLLGVSTKFHGRGHGRDLVHASISKAISEGVKRVDLHTWGGNLKAVPMYKKAGFMWIPDTHVFMQNFIPMIVNSGMAPEIFDGIDWYKVHVRELAVEEDIDSWEGMKVFSYKFKHDDKSLHVKINRFAREIVYFENDDFMFCLKPPEKKALRGRELNARLEVVSRNNDSVNITLTGFGAKGITSDYKDLKTVEGSGSFDIPFTVGHETTKCSNYDKYPTAGVEIAIGDRNLKLGIGFETKPVVEIKSYPVHPVLAKNRESKIRIELSNNAENPVSGTLNFENEKGIDLKCDNPAFELDVDGRTSVEIALSADSSFALPISANFNINGESGKTASTDVPILVDNPVGMSMVTSVDQEYFKPYTDIARDGLIMRSFSRSARSSLFDPVLETVTVEIIRTAFGPPFDPSLMNYAVYEQVIHDDGTIEMRSKIDKNPVLEHIQEVLMIGGRWISVINGLKNTGDETVDMGLQASISPKSYGGNIKFARDGRIISGMRIDEGYPSSEEIPRDPSEFSEKWIAYENDQITLGILFADDVEIFDRYWSGHCFEYTLKALKPGETRMLEPLYVYAGPGDHNTVRNAWYRFFKGQVAKPEPMEVHNLRRLFTVPEIPVIEGESEVEIVFENLRLAPAAGDVVISADGAVDVSENRIHFDEVMRDKPFKHKISVESKDKSAGVSRLNLKLDSASGSAEKEIPVLRADRSAKVSIAQDGNEYVVSNDLAEYRIDPSYGGGIHSLNTLGQEWMMSPYPDKRKPFCWYNPWRGGIRPTLRVEDDWYDGLYKEDFKIAEHSVTDGAVRYKGLTAKTTVEKIDALKGLEVESAYMLSEGHRILKATVGVRNLYDVSRRLVVGYEFFQKVHPEHKTRQIFDYENDTERKAGKFAAYHPSRGWIITENVETGKCSLILMPHWDMYRKNLWVGDHCIEYGQHVFSESVITLKGNEELYFDHYYIACENVDEAKILVGLIKS